MSSFVIALAVPLILGALGWAVRPQAAQLGHERVVEYGWGLRGFAALLAFLACAAALASLLVPPSDRPDVLGIAGIFALPTFYLMPHAFLTRFLFDQVGIRSVSPWRKMVVVAWDDIVNVRYSAGEQSYVVVAPGGNELKLHAYMSGVSTLVSEMQRRDVRGALLAQAIAGH